MAMMIRIYDHQSTKIIHYCYSLNSISSSSLPNRRCGASYSSMLAGDRMRSCKGDSS